MSLVAWLDTSLEQQRRAREIIKLFSDSATIDDLGIGQIRDALGDGLFPGSSTLLTRARYLLLVPWAFQVASGGSSARSLWARAEEYERSTLTAILKTDPDAAGLIGKRAGKNVRTLPSQIYWTALRTYGILEYPISQQQISSTTRRTSEATELAERRSGPWVATLPNRPPDFPYSVAGSLDLTAEEASWLQERIVLSVPDSLLGSLARNLDPDVIYGNITPWDALRSTNLPTHQRELLGNAELFSRTMQGAGWLYNVLLAEAYAAGGWTPEYGVVDAEHYRESFRQWADEMRAIMPRLHSWNLTKFWRSLGPVSSRIGPPTQLFVNQWIQSVRDGSALTSMDNRAIRTTIQRRESAKKGPQAMLANSRRLASWTGNSGTALLTFRWANVTRILADLREGLDRAGT